MAFSFVEKREPLLHTGMRFPYDPDKGFATLRSLLSRFTYKPGWRFTLYGSDCKPLNPLRRCPSLEIQFDAPDVGDPSNIIPILGIEPIPWGLLVEPTDESVWQKWLYMVISRAEHHEIDEFFKVDGVAPFDPHAERGR